MPSTNRTMPAAHSLAFACRPLLPFLLSGAIVGAVKWGWLTAVPW